MSKNPITIPWSAAVRRSLQVLTTCTLGHICLVRLMAPWLTSVLQWRRCCPGGDEIPPPSTGAHQTWEEHPKVTLGLFKTTTSGLVSKELDKKISGCQLFLFLDQQALVHRMSLAQPRHCRTCERSLVRTLVMSH